MIKRIVLLGLLGLLLSLAACGDAQAPESPAPTAPEPWRQAEVFLAFATNAQQQDTGGQLVELLLEASGGRIYCNAYAGGQIGTDVQLMQALQSGTISVVQCATSMQTEQVPELALLDTPYLFADLQACNEALNGVLLDFFQPYYNQAGLQLLCWYCPGYRQLTSNLRVERIEDIARLTIRTMENPLHQLYWASLGAEVLPLPFGDLFYAIQQDVVNAQENTPNATISMELHQVQDSIILTDHLPFIYAIVMNKSTYDSLAPADQASMVQAFQAYSQLESTVFDEALLADYFAEVLLPDRELRTGLAAGAAVVREALYAQLGAEVAGAFYALFE